MLHQFERASGQQVNYAKSSVFLIINLTAQVRDQVCSILQVQEAGANSMYLGLPNTMGRNKNSILVFLKEKMRKRIKGWEAKVLSKGGKEIVLKIVAQSLPSYAMGVFLLPATMCSDLERMMNKFW